MFKATIQSVPLTPCMPRKGSTTKTNEIRSSSEE